MGTVAKVIKLDMAQYRRIVSGEQRFCFIKASEGPMYTVGDPVAIYEVSPGGNVYTANEIRAWITLVLPLNEIGAPHLVVLGLLIEQIHRTLVNSAGQPLRFLRDL